MTSFPKHVATFQHKPYQVLEAGARWEFPNLRLMFFIRKSLHLRKFWSEIPMTSQARLEIITRPADGVFSVKFKIARLIFEKLTVFVDMMSFPKHVATFQHKPYQVLEAGTRWEFPNLRLMFFIRKSIHLRKFWSEIQMTSQARLEIIIRPADGGFSVKFKIAPSFSKNLLFS